MTLRVEKLIARELADYRAARTGNDPAKAWIALERAHILSQPYLVPHLAIHWEMLKFSAAECDVKEIVGQIARLALAPLGSLTGRIPVGNTGRSDVSAFKSMPIPEDLRDDLARHDN